MPISNRYFGLEIEFFGIRDRAVKNALQAIGITLHTGWGPAREWTLKYDSSVTRRGTGRDYGGHELVSPKLKGEEALDKIREICKALSAAGAKVDRSCGIHVHIDALGLSGREIGNVAYRYRMYEEKIDAFMPQSRRTGNHYCGTLRRISETNATRLLTATSGSRAAACLGGDRYLKLNLESFITHGSIEFRQHSGSLNGEKIVNWIRFCNSFVEASRLTNNNIAAGATTSSAPARRRRNRFFSPRASRLIGYLNTLTIAGHGSSPYSLATASGLSVGSIPAAISTLRSHGARIDCRHGRYVVMAELPFQSGLTAQGMSGGRSLYLRPTEQSNAQSTTANIVSGSHLASNSTVSTSECTVPSSQFPFSDGVFKQSDTDFLYSRKRSKLLARLIHARMGRTDSQRCSVSELADGSGYSANSIPSVLSNLRSEGFDILCRNGRYLLRSVSRSLVFLHNDGRSTQIDNDLLTNPPSVGSARQAAPANPPRQRASQRDSLWSMMDPEIISFYEERAQDLEAR